MILITDLTSWGVRPIWPLVSFPDPLANESEADNLSIWPLPQVDRRIVDTFRTKRRLRLYWHQCPVTELLSKVDIQVD